MAEADIGLLDHCATKSDLQEVDDFLRVVQRQSADLAIRPAEGAQRWCAPPLVDLVQCWYSRVVIVRSSNC